MQVLKVSRECGAPKESSETNGCFLSFPSQNEGLVLETVRYSRTQKGQSLKNYFLNSKRSDYLCKYFQNDTQVSKP